MRFAPIVGWLGLPLTLLAACTPPSASTPDFALSLERTAVVAVPGGSATTSVPLAPLDGSQGDVMLAIADRSCRPYSASCRQARR